MRAVVVDTNVRIVANRASEQASFECIEASVDALLEVRERRIVALDQHRLMVDEYLRHASAMGQPGVGDLFRRHLLDNMYNPKACRIVPITPTEDGSFEEFPEDPMLAGFDRDDRKFVAVALGCDPIATILNAVDTDWPTFKEPLRRHGIEVCCLCPAMMRRARCP